MTTDPFRRGTMIWGCRPRLFTPGFPRPPLVSSPASNARRASDRFVGEEIPSLRLACHDERSLDVGQLAQDFPLVLYFYPAVRCPAPTGCDNYAEDTSIRDSVQHRAFRDSSLELEELDYRAIGISSQSPKTQVSEIFDNRLAHTLLADPELHFARLLDLPTTTVNGVTRYRRLTLIVSAGVVKKAFFPIDNASRSAAQTIAWMKLQVTV
jgi:peroxiredoxin